MTTLEETLRSEERACPLCGYIVINPFTERCPRCLTALPPAEPCCERCAHIASCPAGSARKTE